MSTELIFVISQRALKFLNFRLDLERKNFMSQSAIADVVSRIIGQSRSDDSNAPVLYVSKDVSPDSFLSRTATQLFQIKRMNLCI